MKQKKIIGAVVVVLVLAAGLWWFLQPARVTVKAVAVSLAEKAATIPESQYPVDPKSPALLPPPTPPMVPPPPKTQQSPQAPSPSITPPADPQADLKTVFPDIGRLIREGNGLVFKKTYTPPDELVKMGEILQQRQAQEIVNAQAAPQDPQLQASLQQMNETAAQDWEALADQTPTFNATGDEATYVFTAHAPFGSMGKGGGDISYPLVMVKINGKWYTKQ